MDIQGTTHTVEPFEGGPIKRVHTSERRPCAVPVPKPQTKSRSLASTQPVIEGKQDPPEPGFVVVEEFHPPFQPVSAAPAVSDRVDFLMYP